MPSRNIIRENIAESYYHVYARGASKQIIFREEQDYLYFLKLLERYLGPKRIQSKTGEFYPNFANKVELLTYCCMTNHFHLLLYQVELGSIAKFMQSLMTSYSRYFNLKYKRTGSLFESRYRSSRISNDNYLQHISRYIHLNPRYWKQYPYSSMKWYIQTSQPDWLKIDRILELFANREEYLKFVADYEDQRNILAELKHELADN